MSTMDMDENWEAGGNEMNIQSDGEPPAHKPAINKVIPVHYHTHWMEIQPSSNKYGYRNLSIMLKHC